MRSLSYTLLFILATLSGYVIATRMMEETRDFR